MKKCEGVEVWHHSIVNLVLVRGQWSASWPNHFTPTGRAPQNALKKRLVGPASQDILEERKVLTLPEITPQFLCSPAHRLVTVPITLSQLDTEMVFMYTYI
jgi:hypothetical protein